MPESHHSKTNGSIMFLMARGEWPLWCLLTGRIGSVVSLRQLKLEAEKQPLNFNSPEADLRQIVLPANSAR
jgi:hypothetical protein